MVDNGLVVLGRALSYLKGDKVVVLVDGSLVGREAWFGAARGREDTNGRFFEPEAFNVALVEVIGDVWLYWLFSFFRFVSRIVMSVSEMMEERYGIWLRL